MAATCKQKLLKSAAQQLLVAADNLFKSAMRLPSSKSTLQPKPPPWDPPVTYLPLEPNWPIYPKYAVEPLEYLRDLQHGPPRYIGGAAYGAAGAFTPIPRSLSKPPWAQYPYTDKSRYSLLRWKQLPDFVRSDGSWESGMEGRNPWIVMSRTTPAKLLEEYYKNVPGGFDAAAESAREYAEAGRLPDGVAPLNLSAANLNKEITMYHAPRNSMGTDGWAHRGRDTTVVPQIGWETPEDRVARIKEEAPSPEVIVESIKAHEAVHSLQSKWPKGIFWYALPSNLEAVTDAPEIMPYYTSPLKRAFAFYYGRLPETSRETEELVRTWLDSAAALSALRRRKDRTFIEDVLLADLERANRLYGLVMARLPEHLRPLFRKTIKDAIRGSVRARKRSELERIGRIA